MFNDDINLFDYNKEIYCSVNQFGKDCCHVKFISFNVTHTLKLDEKNNTLHKIN